MILPNTVPPTNPLHPGLPPMSLAYLIGFFIVIAVFVIAMVAFARKVLHKHREQDNPESWEPDAPSAENSSAFMAASMQGVIERLRAQEKELAIVSRDAVFDVYGVKRIW